MRIIRWVLPIVLLVAAGLLPRPAFAHNSTIKGLVNLMPEVPAPGQSVRLQVDLLDVYDSDVPGALIRASFATDGKPVAWTATLREDPIGVYTGEVRTPEAGQAVIQFEATLPDGKWYGELYLRVGPRGRAVFQEPIEFIHEDELKKQTAVPQSVPAQAPPPVPVQAPPPVPVSSLAETAVPATQSVPPQPEPQTAPSPSTTAALSPQPSTSEVQKVGTQPEPGNAQAQPKPSVSADQLHPVPTQVSRPYLALWVLTGGAAALGVGVLWWYRGRIRKLFR